MAITVKHSKVSLIPDGSDTSVVRPSDWNDDHVLVGLGTMAEQDADDVAITGGTISGVAVTGYVPTTRTITAGTGLTGGGDLSANRTLALANTAVTTGTYGTAARTITQTVDQQGRLTNIFDQPIEIANTQVTGLGTASTKDAGVALGVATLDAGGKVPASQIPLQGDLNYQGTWNATTNTPTLTSGTGTKGYYYVVDVAGTTNLDGITDWQVGDWAIFNGTVWQKVDNTDAVTSVNGQVGTVTITLSGLGAGTIATQNANNVAITGGTVDGTAIGNTTRSSVKATTIDATGAVTLPASTSSLTPLNIEVGTTPSTPVDGDIWVEANGIFAHTAGFSNQLDVDTNMSGVLDMPTITITGSGATFNATSVKAFLFSLPTFSGDFRKYTIPAATGLALVDQTTTYLIVKYNGGSPVFDVTLNVADINGSDVAGAALLFRNGTEVHHQSVNWGLAPASRNNRRLIQTRRYERGAGLALGESTGRVITVSSGIIWYGVTEYAETAQTSASSNAEFWFHVAGVWTKSVVSTYNNTQYDNGTNLVTLSGAGTQYAVNWVYRYLDGAGLPKLAYVLGGGNYNLAQAVASGSPTPPAILSQMAILVGRIIVAQNAATATQIDSAFTQVFAGSTVTDHNDLANLQGGTTDEYFHLTSAEYTGTGTGTFVRASSPTLTSPNLDTPTVLVGTNITGTGASFTAGNATKLSTGRTIAITGDLAYTSPSFDGSANVTATGTLATVNSNVGSFTNASVTVNAKGLVTAVSNGTAPVTSVGVTAPLASTGGTTPTLSIPAATGSVNGYLTSTDWTTFNGKANAFTYTTSYIPYGQGTTTPNQSSSLTFASSTLTAPIVSASNGLVVNSNTVSASYSIPSGSSASSVGPMTVASGQTVTIASGSRWVVL